MNQPPLIITPLSDEQQQQVFDVTHAYIKKAENIFDIKLKPVEIVFDLKGRAAGMYRIRSRNRGFFSRATREIRYNSFIFSQC